VTNLRNYNWSEELAEMFRKVENVKHRVEAGLSSTFRQEGLEWDSQVMKCVSGDIYTKVLGSLIRRMLQENEAATDIFYEVPLSPTRLRADILIGGNIAVESKAQGIFSMKGLKDRCCKVNQLCQSRRDLVPVLVVWRQNSSYLSKIREFILPSYHYYFHNLSLECNQPTELERLITNIIGWLPNDRPS
jgi:hypothetical protein